MTLSDYAKKFIGRPYIWGGDGSGRTFGGFDCSGLVLECLMAFGLYGGPDTTAQGLFKYFLPHYPLNSTKEPRKVSLLFFGTKEKISHVAIGLDERFMIEAGGGGIKCNNLETSTGMVRIRPIKSRKDFVAAFIL